MKRISLFLAALTSVVVTSCFQRPQEYVDLGLSVKWATSNLGAANPEEYGDYYAWGETETKAKYSEDTYKYFVGEWITNYCVDSKIGTVDNKTVLEPEDDVVHVKLGGKWRMPTIDEWDELEENCEWTWTDDYKGVGAAGYIVRSKKPGYTNNSIFLPAAGGRYFTDMFHAGSNGYYWSSSLYTDCSSFARYLNFDSGYVYASYGNRYYGRSVRPVSE